MIRQHQFGRLDAAKIFDPYREYLQRRPPLGPHSVSPRSYICTSCHERFERLGVIEEQPILDHAGIVVLQRLCAIADRHELQAAVDGRCIVDRRAVGGLLREEHRLMPGDSVGQFAIGESGVREAGFI